MQSKKLNRSVNIGEIDNIISSSDWSHTSLGPLKDWPQSLRSALNMCLTANSPMSICWGDDLIMLYNEAWGERVGDAHPSAFGRPASELFENWNHFQYKVDQVMETGKAMELPNQFLDKKRQYLMDLSFVPVPDDTGSISGVYITASKSNLKMRNAWLSAIVKGSDDAIISKDLNSRITSWNDSAERIFGYSADEAVGQPITMLFPEELVEEEDEIINRIKNGERVDHYETVRKRKDGRLLDVSLTISPIRDATGKILGASKIARDITRRKANQEKREQLLQEVEAERTRLSDIFQHAPSFMCIMQGPDHIYERANDSYHQLVGDRPLIGKPARQALPELAEQGALDLLDKVYETGEPHSVTEKHIFIEQGDEKLPRERYVDIVYQPLHDSEGEVTGIFVQGVDLTERKLAKEKLKKMNASLEERVEERTSALLSYQDQLRTLASRLSKAEEKERHRLATELHDNLGQMLAVTKMKMDLLQKDQLPDKMAEEVMEIKEGVNDAIVYTRDLMSDLKPPPSLDKEDVRATINWLAEKMQKHHLQVEVVDDEQPKRTSKEIRNTLLQCVRELLFNVIKHAEVDEAKIRLSRVNNELHVVVEDEGQGFDPDDERMMPTDEGGFGLFNISERIDLMGGSMAIDSKPGKGTQITIKAPLYKEETGSDGQEEARSELTPTGAPKIKVLLADDHQMFQEGLKKLVHDEEDMMVVARASNGKEAIEEARKTSPDVIVMDVSMPEKNGIEATREILSFMPEARIIGLSSLDDYDEVRDSMMNAGATAYLSKNEAMETLCATIRGEAKLLKEYSGG